MFELIFFAFLSPISLAQVILPIHCNGQPTVVGTDPLFANGRAAFAQSEPTYPNGTQVRQAGELVYPNGQRMEISGEEHFMSGQKVFVAGELYYPNGQRVQISGDCFYQSGTKMPACPQKVDFQEDAAGVRITGTLELGQLKIVDRKYEMKEPTVTTSWSLKPTGELMDVKTTCL